MATHLKQLATLRLTLQSTPHAAVIPAAILLPPYTPSHSTPSL